jgi:hypothetical protein
MFIYNFFNQILDKLFYTISISNYFYYLFREKLIANSLAF